MATIYFGGAPDYNQTVYGVFAAVEGNQVGRAIISRIRNSKRELTIAPYTEGGCNAKTRAEDAKASAPVGVWKNAPKEARWYKGHDDDPRTRSVDERYDVVKRSRGTGTGSDVTILFTPGIYGASGCHGGTFGSMPDEVLFHELVHGLRQIQGKYNQIPTGDSFTGYGNEEEFLAIVATNVYISAKGGTQLRGGHDGHYALRPPLDTSTGFLADADNLRLMNIYRLIWADAFLDLSNVVGAKFNPFRELTNRLAYLGPVGS